MKKLVVLFLFLSTVSAGCTPQQTLTALELARKLGDAVCSLCPDDDAP